MALKAGKTRTAAKKRGTSTAAKRRNAGAGADMQQPTAGFMKWQGTGNRYGYFDMPRTTGTGQKRGGGQGGGSQANI